MSCFSRISCVFPFPLRTMPRPLWQLGFAEFPTKSNTTILKLSATLNVDIEIELAMTRNTVFLNMAVNVEFDMSFGWAFT